MLNIFGLFSSIIKLKLLRIFCKPIKPRVIAYDVTWRCNCKCPMCGVSRIPENQKRVENELTFTDIKNIFQDSALHKLDLVRFTGGEPFLKEDFIQIVDEIRKTAAPKYLYITTNASYPERVVEFVEYFGRRKMNFNIQLSIDAVGEKHDRIRGVPGLFTTVYRTMESLEKLKEKYNFNVGINQVILNEDFNSVIEMNKLAKKFRFSHRMWLAVETHESDILQSGGQKLDYELISGYKKEVLIKLYQHIENLLKEKRKNNSIVEYFWSYLYRYLIEGAKNRILKGIRYPDPPCQTLFCYFRLMPNGDIMPCTLKPIVVGNLKREKFSEIWFSKKTDLIRNEIKNCQGCWVECDVVANAIYSGDFFIYYIKKLLKYR